MGLGISEAVDLSGYIVEASKDGVTPELRQQLMELREAVRNANDEMLALREENARLKPPPATRLAQLKTIVKHVGATWTHVVRAHTYLHGMGRNEHLRRAMDHFYPANVQNTLEAVLTSDLIRCLGALILDRDSRTGSVNIALALLEDPEVRALLKAEYEIVPPLPEQSLNEPDMTPELAEQIERAHQANGLKRNMAQFATLDSSVKEIRLTVLKTKTTAAIRTARNKGIAHYEVIRDGEDWRMWRISEVQLTYPQLAAYVEVCTQAIHMLSALVCQSSHNFDRTRHDAESDVGLYVDALVAGLDAQRREKDERRAAKRGMRTRL